jgi:hypothetical protein
VSPVTGRHRIKGVKREHSVIHGLLPVLESIAKHPGVGGVIPGRISVTHGATMSLQLRLGPRTMTGVKLSARRGTSAQEVFVVAPDVDSLLEFLRAKVPEFRE